MRKHNKSYNIDQISFDWKSEPNSGSMDPSNKTLSFTYPSNDEIISEILKKHTNRKDILNEMKEKFVFDEYCEHLLDEYIKKNRDDKINNIIE